jgi:hypothetical protein
VARSIEALSEICDAVLLLMAASVVHSVILRKPNAPYRTWINSASLSYLMQCQSLKALLLRDLDPLDVDHCRVLGAHSRPGLEITLENCRITGAAA